MEKDMGMSIDPDTYSPNIFVVERNTVFQQDLTKEGLWMLSLKGSLIFCFSEGETKKEGSMVSKWNRKKEKLISNLGKGNRGEEKGREGV